MVNLWRIIERLRGEHGCPWDRQQTPESLQTYLVEEAHEAAGAVRSGRSGEAAEELGDLLFILLFVIYLYEERGLASLEEVCRLSATKMIRRHPHVFADTAVENADQVRDNWERIKAREDREKGRQETLNHVPATLPALMRAYRLLSRRAQRDPGLNRREEQIAVLRLHSERIAGVVAGEHPPGADTFGQVLLTLVNVMRLDGFRPEDCLHKVLDELTGAGAGVGPEAVG
jgi:MazG family protein